MTRRMADSVTVADLPEGFDLYGAYVDGLYKNYAQAEARFPGKVVGIAVFSTTNDGTVGDCETGDMTPQTAVAWVKMRRAAGVDPTIYCSVSEWPAVQNAFNQLSTLHPHWWIAAYPGIGPVLYPGSVAHQWIDHGPYDESVVADFWPGVDSAPPQPSLEGAVQMDSVIAPNGDNIAHYRTPQNHLLEVTRKAGTQGEPATTGLSIIDITQAYPQFQVAG